MMTQPSGATGAAAAGAAVLVGASTDGSDGAGAELPCTPGGANPVPFSQALLALATGTDPAGTLLAGAGAGAAAAAAADALAGATGSRSPGAAQGTGEAAAPAAVAPAGAAESLPRDLLQALFAIEAAAPEAGGTSDKTGQAGIDTAHAAATARELRAGATKTDKTTATQAAAADPGAALLAAVLQWLQQQHAGTRATSAADTSDGGGKVTATDEASTAAVAAAAAAASAPIVGSSTAGSGAGRADGAGAAASIVAATPGATLAGQFTSQREGDGHAAGDDRSRAPATIAGSASNAGASAGMDMAAALRAASEAIPVQVERNVSVPVHERHWPTALATQVLVLSNDKVQAATLRLSPEHLGPVEVHIDLQDANVNVSFTAAHAETRAALEQAMPQLRAVLAGAGLSLGQATVQQHARRESQNSNALPRTGGAADEPIESPATLVRALGMIDEYV
jgi:flagellar hook-length control protein FliK